MEESKELLRLIEKLTKLIELYVVDEGSSYLEFLDMYKSINKLKEKI